jgi:putative CRISPR-associated protein (TIGR02619 family)
MRTILTTVGISLLQNAKRHHGLSRGESPSDQQLSNYLRHEDAKEVSAETNALHRLGLQSDDRIVFLHSATEKSAVCAEFLSRHYAGTVDSISTREIQDLSYEEGKFKLRGLRSLVGTLTELIEEAQGEDREVLINATGGFKAEIAFATLVGLLFDVPVYYIHERFRDIVEMPVLPIDWDYSLLYDHRDLFEWVFSENPPIDEVNQRLKGRPAKLRSLLTEENGEITLSPAGLAVYAAYLEQVEESPSDNVFLSARAREVYESGPSREEKLDRLFAKLQKPKLRDGQSQAMKSSSNAFLYPRGHRDERVVYIKAGDERAIYVCEVLVERQGSELREITADGVDLDDYTGFRLWDPSDA